MRADELWVEAYQGEVLGEALFAALAERETDPERRRQLEVMTLLERATKELAEPVLGRLGIDRGDSEATRESARQLAETVSAMAWEDLLRSFEPVTSQYVATYRQLAERATDDEERALAETYIAHEHALLSFARRTLGEESGDPFEPILSLPHVATAVG